MAREDGFFDDLARGLADGSLTRGRALRLMGAAVLGASLGSLSGGVAWADDDDCKPRGRRCKRNRQCCSKNCIENPSGSGKVCGCPTGKTPCGGRCVTNCTSPKVLDANCQCVCPPGQVECSNGSCVSNSCPPGQIFDPSICACVAQCLPNGSNCSAETLCCSGTICANGKCCTPDSTGPNTSPCTADTQCCNGFCTTVSPENPDNSFCSSCREPGGSCTSVEDCCRAGGACINGTCCSGPGGTCYSDAGCCFGSCINNSCPPI